MGYRELMMVYEFRRRTNDAKKDVKNLNHKVFHVKMANLFTLLYQIRPS